MTWRARAACADTDPEAWFPQPGPGRRGRAFGETVRAYEAEVARLAAICKGCPVEADCLQDALEHDAAGVWGGTTAEQRRGMRGPR